VSRRTRNVRWYVTMNYETHSGQPRYWWVPGLRKWMPLHEAVSAGKRFSSHAHALTKKQAMRIALKMPDRTAARITMCCYRKSTKRPRGFEMDFGYWSPA